MKRWLAVLLAVLLMVSTLGCGGSTDSSEPKTETLPAATPEQEAVAAPTPEPTSKSKTRPIAVDADGFTSTGREIADGFLELLIPGYLFKSVSAFVEKTDLEWDAQHNQYELSCGLPTCKGMLWFYSESAQKLQLLDRDVIPSDMVVFAFSMAEGNQQELETFVTYARDLIYLCSTCAGGLEANEIFKTINSDSYINTSNWAEHDGMKYNLMLNSDPDGRPCFYLSIKQSGQGKGRFIAGEKGFCASVGETFTAVEAMIEDPSSSFYVGKDVSVDRYLPYYPECLELTFNPGKVYVTPFKKYSLNAAEKHVLPETDDETFTFIMVNGFDQYDGFDMDAEIKRLSCALLTLIDETFKDPVFAEAFFDSLYNRNGEPVTIGPFDFCFRKEQIDFRNGRPIYEVEFFIRETAAYM